MMKTSAYTMTCNKVAVGCEYHEMTHCLKDYIAKVGKKGRGRVSDIKPEAS